MTLITFTSEVDWFEIWSRNLESHCLGNSTAMSDITRLLEVTGALVSTSDYSCCLWNGFFFLFLSLRDGGSLSSRAIISDIEWQNKSKCLLGKSEGELQPAADPGFPSGSANPKGGGANLLFGQIFPKLHVNEENWIKMEGVSKIFLCRFATESTFSASLFSARHGCGSRVSSRNQ